jgi:hypothetical protein
MNAKTAALGLLLGATPAMTVLAHPDHKHEAPRPEIDAEAAKARATEELARLVTKKKLEPSWQEATIKGIEKREGKKGWEWLATFDNKAVAGKVLYVFLKPSGDFVAANFTGK